MGNHQYSSLCRSCSPEDASRSINYRESLVSQTLWPVEGFSNKRIFINFENDSGQISDLDQWAESKKITKVFSVWFWISPNMWTLAPNNLICVMADNSDDSSFPAGKIGQLVFTYVGGMYRHVWLIPQRKPTLPMPIKSMKLLAVAYLCISTKFHTKRHCKCKSRFSKYRCSRFAPLYTSLIWFSRKRNYIDQHRCCTNKSSEPHVELSITVENQSSGTLTLHASLVGECSSSIRQEKKWMKSVSVGIRTIELRGEDSLYINGQAFEDKLIVNRRQYHAYVGTAQATTHWYDVKKLRDAGIWSHQNSALSPVSSFHGCGWWTWHAASYSFHRLAILEWFAAVCVTNKINIRQKIRRDRNHPSVMAFRPCS